MGIAPYHDVGRSLVLGETATGIGCWRRATVCHKLVTGWGKGCLRGENQTIGFHPRVLGMFPTPSQKIPKSHLLKLRKSVAKANKFLLPQFGVEDPGFVIPEIQGHPRLGRLRQFPRDTVGQGWLHGVTRATGWFTGQLVRVLGLNVETSLDLIEKFS